jgi:hypothetical protein
VHQQQSLLRSAIPIIITDSYLDGICLHKHKTLKLGLITLPHHGVMPPVPYPMKWTVPRPGRPAIGGGVALCPQPFSVVIVVGCE